MGNYVFDPEDYLKWFKPTEEQYNQYVEEYYKNEYVHIKSKRGVKTREKIIGKALYFQDLIIRKSYTKKDNGVFRLSSEVLKKVIGDEYKTMIKLFMRFGVLNHGDGHNGHKVGEYYYYYEPKKGSTMYSLPLDLRIKTEYTKDKEIIKLIEKEKSVLEEYVSTKIVPEIKNRYGEDFFNNYEKSLRKIKISDKEGLKQYIKSAISSYNVNKDKEIKEIEELNDKIIKENLLIEDENSKIEEINKRIEEENKIIEDASKKEKPLRKKRKKPLKRYPSSNPMIEYYYRALVSRLEDKNKAISKIDNAGRVYHVLTNADRNIKKFLNIDIIADCKNSHPLLFNYFIFDSHDISTEEAYLISSAMHQIKGIDIRSELGEFIPNQLLEKLWNNELLYIYLTSKGIFWDKVLEEYEGLNRNEVKIEMFQQVFYSKKTQVKFYQDKAKNFRETFPTVMQLILKWKKEENKDMILNYMRKQGIVGYEIGNALSVAMMNLEARIFTSILKRLYSKRWNAIHIHDCILIPNTNNKNKPTRQDVIKIMNEVYKEYGLAPIFSD